MNTDLNTKLAGEIPTAAEIYSGMLQTFSARTGYDPAGDSDIAVRLYAAAAQLESLYLYQSACIRQAFPHTAVGEWLDRHAEMRGLHRAAGVCAAAEVTFSTRDAHGAALPIPAGTIVQTAEGVRFLTTADGEIPPGQTSVTLPVRAEQAGAAGNCVAQSLRFLPQPPAGITDCTNQAPAAGGADPESDALLRTRVLESYAVLDNGTNAAFYRRLACSLDGVCSAVVRPCVDGPGTVNIVISAQDGLPSDALLARVTQTLQDAREIAVTVTVSPPTRMAVNISVNIVPAEGVTDAKAQVEAIIRSYFTGHLLGRPFVLAELANRIYNSGAVQNYAFVTPTDDMSVAETVLPVLGVLSVTEVV